MLNNNIQAKDIKYLSKDFNTLKQQLIEFVKVYYPNTFNDFSEGSPGMMFIDMAAYVGDILSFYQDTQLQENFLSLAREKDNLFKLAYSLGYTPKISTAAQVDLDMFQLVPSKVVSGETVPDFDYALTVDEGAITTSDNGVEFRTLNAVNFGFSSSMDPTTVTVYSINSTTNTPDFYLLKKTVKAYSATENTTTFTFGNPVRFPKVTFNSTTFLGISNIVDSDGNRYYEVPYLAQDIIYEKVKNNQQNNPTLAQFAGDTPYLLRTKKVPRRFTTRVIDDTTIELGFGAGISDNADEFIIPNPDNVGLGIPNGLSKLDLAYDPTNFLFTDAYGIPPANTTLTVTYLEGGGVASNVESNTITSLSTSTITNNDNLDNALLGFIRNSLAVNNPSPARGGKDGDTIEEIRQNAISNLYTQQRAVNKNDYIIRTLNLPALYGSIAKIYITPDQQVSAVNEDQINNPLALNMYVLSYDGNKKLTTANIATKENIKTYIEQYRMLTDSINIKDAFVINIGVDFEIIVSPTYNNNEVLVNCLSALRSYFDIEKWQINQPIIVSEIYNNLRRVEGVQSVVNVTINNKNGGNYSIYRYDIESATRKQVVYPSLDPSIFEVKFPNSDIRGRVVSF